MSSRRLRADAQRNRAAVLQAARAAFADEGLSVPLDEIARRAGVGAGTVYRHFPTKEALFEAAVLDRLQRIVSETRSLLDAADAGAAFFEFLQRLVVGSSEAKDLIDALAGANMDAAGLIAAAKQDLHCAGGKLLAKAQRAGAVRGDVGVTELMALVSGAGVALRHQGGDPAVRDRVCAVLRDGLRRT